MILDELAECVSSSENTAQTVEDVVIQEVLNRFLESLPAETRKIFVRRYWYMSSVKEIAEEYNLSQSKVAVTLFRTRGKLKAALEKESVTL